MVRPRLRDRFAARLVAGMLLAFVPLVAVLAALLVSNAATNLEDAARGGLRNAAVQIADRIDGRFGERRRQLQTLSLVLSQHGARETDQLLRDFRANFELLQLVGRDGRVMASTDPSAPSLARRGDQWFLSATGGGETFAQPVAADGTIRSVLAQPVPDGRGGVRGVVLGDLDETIFARFVGAFRLGDTGEAVIRDAGGRLVWRTGLGDARTPREMAARDPLRDRTTDGAPGLALQGRTGATEFAASTGNEAVGGYAPATEPGWAVDVRQDTGEAFSSTAEQRNLAILLGLLGGVLVALFAVVFARRTTRPLTRLAAHARRVAQGDLTAHVDPEGAAELRDLGTSFNEMTENLSGLVQRLRTASRELSAAAGQLSASSEELATTIAQQSSSATQTSATMQELATTTRSIAESVMGVQGRANAMRDVLHRGSAEVGETAERARALAARSEEIGQILVLLDEIAGRSNLLALNASIEAARAGEAGLGFSVVADEVRRLADRSKSEAAKIAELVAANREEAAATLASLEHGSTQMAGGVELMGEVTDAVDEVRFTTAEQDVATGQVAEAMRGVTAAGRQASAAGHQVAAAASQIARLAYDLDESAGAFRTNGAAPDPPADGER